MVFTAANLSNLLPAQSGTAYYFEAMHKLGLDTPLQNNRTPEDVKTIIMRTFATMVAVPAFSGYGAVYNGGLALFETGRYLMARRAAGEEAEACFTKAAEHAANGLTDLIVFVLSLSFFISLMMAIIYAIAPQNTSAAFLRLRTDFMGTVNTYLQSLVQQVPAELVAAMEEQDRQPHGHNEGAEGAGEE